jgi:hypothetical protein
MFAVGNQLYLKLFCNRLQLRDLTAARSLELNAQTPFSHPRLLVADFASAQHTLKQAIDQLLPRGFLGLRLAPQLLIQPMERLEGGLTALEERVLLEMAHGCGARKVRIHVGSELSDAEAEQLLGTA